MMKTFTNNSSKSFEKGVLTFLFFVFFSIMGFAQSIGISPTGTTPPNSSAGLDVNFTSKGLLIPRVELVGTTNSQPLAAHVAGMLVYNTATVADVIPGFYYNDGSKWNFGLPKATNSGDIQYWNGTDWVTLPIGNAGQVLQLDPSGMPFWADNQTLPNVVTKAVTSITANSASCGGIVLNDGGNSVTAYGVCWSLSANPTTSDNISNDGTGVGNFTSNITLLNPGTVYYIRAYATTIVGTAYGNELTFTTP